MLLSNDTRHIGRAVEPAVLGHDPIDPGVDLGALRDVHLLYRVRHAAEPGEVGLGLLDSFRVPVCDAHGRAPSREQLGGRKPDAACSTGDGVDLSLEGRGNVGLLARHVASV